MSRIMDPYTINVYKIKEREAVGDPGKSDTMRMYKREVYMVSEIPDLKLCKFEKWPFGNTFSNEYFGIQTRVFTFPSKLEMLF